MDIGQQLFVDASVYTIPIHHCPILISIEDSQLLSAVMQWRKRIPCAAGWGTLDLLEAHRILQ